MQQSLQLSKFYDFFICLFAIVFVKSFGLHYIKGLIRAIVIVHFNNAFASLFRATFATSFL